MGRKQRKFYRANLPTVIWNKKTNSALVEFVGGKFTTEDPEIARVLIKKGYPEVDLEAVNPPDFEAPKGSHNKGDIPVMPSDYNESASLNKQKAQAALQKSIEKEAPKKLVKKEVSFPKKPVESKKLSRKVKRRK